MLKVIIDYPKLEEEKKIIRQNITGEKIEVRPILKATDIMEARKVVRQVYLDEKIEQYIADIVFATRFPEKYDLKELKDMIGFRWFTACIYQSGIGSTQLCVHQTSRLRNSRGCSCSCSRCASPPYRLDLRSRSHEHVF